MTNTFYTRNILPQYLKDLKAVKAKTGQKHLLQEDNDPSHGTRSTLNYAQLFRKKHDIKSHKHPGQSPDLNPQEAVWNILKQRIYHRQYRNNDELKAVIIEEWAKIIQEEIQTRIDKMKERCVWLVNEYGKAIKTSLW